MMSLNYVYIRVHKKHVKTLTLKFGVIIYFTNE